MSDHEKALAAARRIVGYWLARGITSADQCPARHLDELRVALAFLAGEKLG
jgi:hypothetical protein